MPTNNNGRRTRKRKQPDSIERDVDVPKAKRRKVMNKTHISTKKDNKSQSEEPKHATDPYQHTLVPSMPNKHRRSRRLSHYCPSEKEREDNEPSKDTSSDEDENEDDSTSPDTRFMSTHNTPIRPKYTSHQSQPSTPHAITTAAKPELSQSAKKSRATQPYAYTSSKIYSPLTYNIHPYKRPHYKSIPDLYASQDSISFSPQNICSPMKRSIITATTPKISTPIIKNAEISNKTHEETEGETYETLVIPVAGTPLRKSFVAPNNYYNNKDRNDRYKPQKHLLSSISKERWDSLLFVCLGFILGFIVCISVYHENKLNVYDSNISANRHKSVEMHTNDMNALCTCDITTNTSSQLCRPCMDQYFVLESECEQCNDENKRVKSERDRFEKDLIQIRRKCAVNKNGLQNRIQNGNNENTKCDEYKQEIGSLEHELGECNVEWGSCEQLGRQKNKLDEKRVEEIEKQKRKFSLCNEQLKRYKEEKQRKKR